MISNLKISGLELLNMRVPLRIISKKNSKARNRFTGQPFLSKEVRNLQTAIGAYAKKERLFQEPYAGPVAVDIEVHFKNRVHADTANCHEIICDALQDGVIYRNDKQIMALIVVACECGEDAATVRVRTMEPRRDHHVSA